MKRFDVINGSEFERLSHTDMSSVKGGAACISCMKRERKVEISLGDRDPNDQNIEIIHIGVNF